MEDGWITYTASVSLPSYVQRSVSRLTANLKVTMSGQKCWQEDGVHILIKEDNKDFFLHKQCMLRLLADHGDTLDLGKLRPFVWIRVWQAGKNLTTYVGGQFPK